MKRCNVCGETKPYTDFYALATMRDGYRNDCKSCQASKRAARYQADSEKFKERTRAWREANEELFQRYQRAYNQRADRKRAERNGYLKRTYGITIEDYERMLEAQGGVCFICQKPRPEDRTLHVDHDHATGEIRGLLCFRCNNALGDFDDDYELLQNAADYLDRDTELDDLARERAKTLTR